VINHCIRKLLLLPHLLPIPVPASVLTVGKYLLYNILKTYANPGTLVPYSSGVQVSRIRKNIPISKILEQLNIHIKSMFILTAETA
jgi:hypothetical protein